MLPVLRGGMTLSFAGTAGLLLNIPTPTGTSIGTIIAMILVILLLALGQIWNQVRRPPAMAFGGASAVQRVAWAGMCVLFLGLVIMSFVQGRPISPESLITYAMAASWHVGTAATYINVCRNPPPPRRDAARAVSFSGV